ncbi:unnamed protein product [Heterobilharzia americana]|nr:unnamed protein product [Heterobilharzia americana]
MKGFTCLIHMLILTWSSIFQCYYVNSTLYSYPLHTFGRAGLSGVSKQTFLSPWNSKYAENHNDYTKKIILITICYSMITIHLCHRHHHHHHPYLHIRYYHHRN